MFGTRLAITLATGYTESSTVGNPVRHGKPVRQTTTYKTAYTKRPTHNGAPMPLTKNYLFPLFLALSSFAFHLHTANHASKPTTPTTARTAWEKPLLSMGTTYVLSTPECLSTPIALGPSSSHTSMTLSIRSRLHRYLCHGVWLQRRSHDTR